MSKLLSTLTLVSITAGVSLFTVHGQVSGVEAMVRSVPQVAYPKEARETGLEGVVTVAVDVDAAGNVTQVRSAAGPDWVCPDVLRADVVAMREAAKTAAEKTTFVPATKDGQAVASQAWVKVEFIDPKPKPKDQGDLSEANVLAVRSDTGTVTDANGKPVPKMTMRTDGTSSEDKTNEGGAILLDGGQRAKLSSGKIVSGGVLNGKAMTLARPPYPPAARAVHASGAVTIQVVIDEEGKVFSARTVSGHPLLRAAAENAACSSSFTPTLLEGMPVKVSGVITYNFVP